MSGFEEMMKETVMFGNEPERRFFLREDCERLSEQVLAMADGGKTILRIVSGWDANLNWSRNTIALMSDLRTADVEITRVVNGAVGKASTNQIDTASLQATVEAAEGVARMGKSRPPDIDNTYPGNEPLKPFIWDDATVQQHGTERGEVVGHVIERAAAEGLVSAGYLQAGVRTKAQIGSRDQVLYYSARTVTQLSTTMRDWKQKGSGWAGRSSYAWGRIDPTAVATTAIEKCIQSRNPVAVEPGRYMTILEPQATGQLLGSLFFKPVNVVRSEHEMHRSFWWDGRDVQEPYGHHILEYRQAKFGQRVFDAKVSIRQMPMHPDLGTWPYDDPEDPYREFTWVEKGVLMNLFARRDYATARLNRSGGLDFNMSLAMDGGESSIEEMIATTRRGLLVTRFSYRGDKSAQFFEAYTRDGLWLIEDGKISKAVKNFRLWDSPLFIFNDVLMVGPAVPIFSPDNPMVVPPVKVREVNFVSLVDAV